MRPNFCKLRLKSYLYRMFCEVLRRHKGISTGQAMVVYCITLLQCGHSPSKAAQFVCHVIIEMGGRRPRGRGSCLRVGRHNVNKARCRSCSTRTTTTTIAFASGGEIVIVGPGTILAIHGGALPITWSPSISVALPVPHTPCVMLPIEHTIDIVAVICILRPVEVAIDSGFIVI